MSAHHLGGEGAVLILQTGSSPDNLLPARAESWREDWLGLQERDEGEKRETTEAVEPESEVDASGAGGGTVCGVLPGQSPARLGETLGATYPESTLALRTCPGPPDRSQVSNLVRCHRTPKERVWGTTGYGFELRSANSWAAGHGELMRFGIQTCSSAACSTDQP